MFLRRVYVEIVMSLLFVVEFITNILRFVNLGRKRYEKNTRLDGKVVVITGANTGIGKETAYQLSLRGAKVIMGCRDVNKGLAAAKHIIDSNFRADLKVMNLDLSSLSSVRKFAKDLKLNEPKIDILINNAGVMMCPKQKTEDGFEMQFGTNHLGHFLLTLLLIENMKNCSDARIINVSSMHHSRGQIHFNDINLDKNYDPVEAYCQSKLSNILFTKELAKRLGNDSNIKVYALHPGTIKSDLFRHLTGLRSVIFNIIGFLFNIDIELGVQTTLYCALEESLRYETGYYYSNCSRVKYMMKEAIDDKTAYDLWELSSNLVKVENKYRL